MTRNTSTDALFYSDDIKDIAVLMSEWYQFFLDATHASIKLPIPGVDFEYYSSFPGFRIFCSKMKEKLLSMQNRLSTGISSSLPRYSKFLSEANTSLNVDIDEFFENLIETNDNGLEYVSYLIDILSCTSASEAVNAFSPNESYQSMTSNNALPFSSAKLNLNIDFLSSIHNLSQNISDLPSWNQNLNIVTKPNSDYSNKLDKPQLKFSCPPDNSNNPFIPYLVNNYKPNSLPATQVPFNTQYSRSIHGLLSGIRVEDPVKLHPYYNELQNIKFGNLIMEISTPMQPNNLEETDFRFITSEEELDILIEDLNLSKEIAIDLEHHSYRSYLGITCLMQITIPGKDFIIDTLLLRDKLYKLLNPFTNSNIIKILHGADWDICWLQRDFGLFILPLFDTYRASHSLNLPKHSLAYLLKYCCNVITDKQHQLSDWRIRPLPKEMLKYARLDTHYLIYIYQRMKNELIRRSIDNNLLNDVFEQSRKVCLKIYKKPLFEPQGYIRYLNRVEHNLSIVQRKTCELLHKWRDNIARIEDESTEYVLSNNMLFQIVDKMPEDQNGILACCTPIPFLVRKHCSELSGLIKEAKNLSLERVKSHSFSNLPTITDEILTRKHYINNRTYTNNSVQPFYCMFTQYSEDISNINIDEHFEILLMEAEPTLPILSDVNLENSANVFVVKNILSRIKNSLDIQLHQPQKVNEAVRSSIFASNFEANLMLDQDNCVLSKNIKNKTLKFSSNNDDLKNKSIDEFNNIVSESSYLLSHCCVKDQSSVNGNAENIIEDHGAVIFKNKFQCNLHSKRMNLCKFKSSSKRTKNNDRDFVTYNCKNSTDMTGIVSNDKSGIVSNDKIKSSDLKLLDTSYRRIRPRYIANIINKNDSQQINWPY